MCKYGAPKLTNKGHLSTSSNRVEIYPESAGASTFMNHSTVRHFPPFSH